MSGWIDNRRSLRPTPLSPKDRRPASPVTPVEFNLHQAAGSLTSSFSHRTGVPYNTPHSAGRRTPVGRLSPLVSPGDVSPTKSCASVGSRTQAMDLMSRLYDKPEDSHALQVAQGLQPPPAKRVAPRPPSGKGAPSGGQIRTTMFKRDYIRRKQQIKARLDREDSDFEVPLTVGMFHHTMWSKRQQTPNAAQEDNLSLHSVGPEDMQDDTSSIASQSPTKEMETSRKMVTFQEATAHDSPILASPLPEPRTQLRSASAPLNLPLVDSESVKSGKPGSAKSLPPPGGSSRRSRSATYGTQKQDPNIVLSYLKKNVFDDEEPENDNFMETIMTLRKRLGWIRDIPRHGPGCWEALERLQDRPDPNKNLEAYLASKEDDGKFVYALPRNRNDPRGRYNPYDLQVVSAHVARSCKVYWTASATNINRFVQRKDEDKEDYTSIATLHWFWEKRLFDAVFDKKVFQQFRIWKAFSMWKLNVRHLKNSGNRAVLYKTLFTANEILQGCLLHVRGLCESACSSSTGFGEGESAISLVCLDKSKTYTLSQFMEVQQMQNEAALNQLNVLRDKVVRLLWESCATVAEMEGVTQGIRPDEEMMEEGEDGDAQPEEEERFVKYKVKTKYGEIPIYEKKESKKKDKPSYAQIAEWRKILHRLSFFLRMVDYLLLDLLRRLVLTATRELLKFIKMSHAEGIDKNRDSDSDAPTSSQSETDSMTSGTSSPRKQEEGIDSGIESVSRPSSAVPDIDAVLEELGHQNIIVETPQALLAIELVLEVPELPPLYGAVGQMVGGKLSRGRSRLTSEGEGKKTVSFHDADITDDEVTEEDEDEEGKKSEEEREGEEEDGEVPSMSKPKFAYTDAPQQSQVVKVGPEQKAQVQLSPACEEVQNGFRSIIAGFENTIAQVVSMLRESSLAAFYSPPKYDLKLNFDLEKKEEEEEEMRPWPDTLQLFGDDMDYQTLISDIMEHITAGMEIVSDYSEEYDQYCGMVERARRVDVTTSMARKTWSTEEFHHMLTIHTEQMYAMKEMTKEKRLGMINVQSENFCQSCLPYPQQVLDDIRKNLPVVAAKRNEELLNIIKSAGQKLDKYPHSVEEFVDHLSFLSKMTSEMPALEKEFAVVTKLYTIARDFGVTVEPEELALYQTLSPSFQHLKTVILYAEAKKEDNIRKFSSDLDSLIHDIRDKIFDIKNRVRDPSWLSIDTLALVALEHIRDMTDEVTSLTSKARSYSNYQERFGSSLQGKNRLHEEFQLSHDRDQGTSAQAIQAELSEIERDLTLRRLLWESQEEWTKLEAEWTASMFDSLHVENLQKNVNRFTQTVFMLEKGLPHNEVVPRLKEKVLAFKQIMPVITSLRNPALKERHWEQIEAVIGRAIIREKGFTLGHLLDMNIIKHKEKIQDISNTASNEATLERMLQKVMDLWQSTDFRLVPHSSTNVFIIAGADDIMAQLEESQVTIGTIRGSRYVNPIKAQVEEWERKLSMFARTLEEWMTCQRNWLYLEQIFTTPDIQRQLPSESKLFAQVDKSWKDIMRKTEDRPNALRSATAPGVLEMVQSCNSNLEKIQKCLEDYLETKRLVFPRFYFLSNDELLDILAQSKNPEAVQPHLGKCFGNIKALEIRTLPRQPPTVKSITSAEGEVIIMPKNVRARGPVEQWLGSVEAGMFDTVKKHLKLGLQDWIGINLENWVLKHPGQVVLTVAQVMFNREVVNCFNAADPLKALIEYREKMVATLNILAGLVVTNLVPHKRLSVNALLTIDVHNRDIVSSMIDNQISRRDDFEWTRQLRYEWDEQSNNCNVLQCNATFQYGYEYLGCSPRLVMTPLTDRCYLTLTGALHLHLGGSPAGPAGTGKTETVKDLAKSMGKQCVVFNCSEGLDYKMLGKFFSGLSQSGSWCCFDEFNRIDVEVLSVVAQQVHTVKAAKDQRTPRFMFEGRDIKLNMTCGFFITMNPSYAGRVELPDNLKSLFRQVAMMVPDYTLIAEIMLFSEGFTAAKSLSTKVVNLYKLASKQLSQQDHYDFGMRAIKSVLVMAGSRKRQLQFREDIAGRDITQQQESCILISSLRDANLPKFLAEDVPLFESILADLFPGVISPEPDQGILDKAISMSVRDQGLQHWPSQIEKVKQLYSQILVRHGVMLVGPTGGGKTTVRTVLQRALVLLPTISMDDDSVSLNDSGRKQSLFVHNRAKKGHVETFSINPKCVKLGELYGETDPNTFEWTDGLIATATRRFAKGAPSLLETQLAGRGSASHMTSTDGTDGSSSRPASEGTDGQGDSVAKQPAESMETVPHDWRWLILDGPVDTIWVENLNTVLDDTKMLCLANGERIALNNSMRLLFEVDDLSHASPATISRCAMVYMDPVDLGWKPYVKTWLSRLPRDIPETGRQHLQALFNHSVNRGINFLRQYSKHLTVPTPDSSAVTCLCAIMNSFFEFMSKNGGFGEPDEPLDKKTSDNESESSQSQTGSTDKKKKKHSKKKGKGKEQLDPIAEKKAARQTPNMRPGKEYYLQRNPSGLTTLMGKLFVFAFTWSFGGNFKRFDDLDDDAGISRKGSDHREVVDLDIASEFDNFIHELFEVEPPLGVRMPAASKTIYSYFVDMDSGNFILWDSLVPSTQSLIEKGTVLTLGETMGMGAEQHEEKPPQDDEIVPTVDTVRYSFLISLLLMNRNPVLLTGDSGVGKSVIIKHMLKRLGVEGGTSSKSGTILGDVFNFTDKNQALLDNISSLTKLGDEDEGMDNRLDMILGGPRIRAPPGITSTMLQFSAQTTAARTQQAILHKLIKKGRDTMGAPKGKKVVVFVDDLNLPAPEEYGAQPPLELLRQFLDFGGFYDTKKLVWKDILDVTLVGACGPPGGGRNPVSLRLLKHFCMLALPQPSTRSLQHIYQVSLGRFFQDGEFTQDVKDCLFPLVSASIAIYYRMCGTMRPTPTKTHYTFNIRDLSQVVGGLLQADESVIVNSEHCAQLLAHEGTRVFHDRLVDFEDRRCFFVMLTDVLHDYFKVKWTEEKMMRQPVMFADFIDVQEGNAVGRLYRPISDHNKLTQILEECYMRQNVGNAQAPQMVFFREAVEHILRAARVFRQPGGHMLMVGLDGTGKTSTVSLAAYIAGCEMYKLTLCRGYDLEDFREDIKKVCVQAGVKNISTVFLLTENDIASEAFLEDINCILNSGEVPDLFDTDELDNICMELKNEATETQVPDTRVAMYEFFIRKIRKNLHIVLTMSPAGTKFRQRCRMNPSLVNCCTIDWYDEWTNEAMMSVANMYFHRVEFVAAPDCDIQKLKEKVARQCVFMHEDVAKATVQYLEELQRHFYVTPSSYIELIRLYSSMLQQQKSMLMDNKDRLNGGLSSLSEANALVGTMQEELVTLGPRIEEKAKETEVLLQQLEKDKEAVAQVREIVEAEEAEMKKETQIVQDYADECQQDLASVLPLLESAIQSLDALDKKDISEVRMYINPPELVVTVMAAVCILLQEKSDWATAKLILADPQFLKRLKNYDQNLNVVPERIFTRLKRYSKHPDFTPEKVGTVSLACKSMCHWILAVERYHEVYKMAKPKQKRVNEAREALKLAQENLAQKQASLAKIQEHMRMLEQRYEDSVSQRESLKERKKVTALRLKRASILIGALSDEKVRWADSVRQLDEKLKGLVGDTLISSAVVAYLGSFTSKYRRDLTEKWDTRCRKNGVPLSEEYNFIKSMVEPNEVLHWHNEGLPQDTHSTENAIIIKRGRRWPLLIDPQGQASKWLEEMEGTSLKIIQASDPNYMRTMERAIRVGDPVLLQGCTEDLDPSLKPILTQETYMRGGSALIRLGDTEIEYNESFRLYLATSLGNPHFLPGVCIQVSVINFTVTFEGLQEQLLSSVVRQEGPELETERSQLLESIASDFQMLRDLENKTLSLLHNSEGNILDDEDLVQTLHKSKGMAGEIKQRVHQSEETERLLNQARQKYLPVSTRGAVLYFVLADLAHIDVMYQFSLAWFQEMFVTCIDLQQQQTTPRASQPMSGKIRPSSARGRRKSSTTTASSVTSYKANVMSADELNSHLRRMIDRVTASVYRMVCVGLFSRHQLMFSFMLCTSIMRAASKQPGQVDPGDLGLIMNKEWNIFLQGPVMASMMDEETVEELDGLSPIQRLEVQNKGTEIKPPSCITDTMWRQCQHLESSLSAYDMLCRSIMNNTYQWERLCNSPAPLEYMNSPFTLEEDDAPLQDDKAIFPWERLTPFQKLLLVKVLCPVAVTGSVRLFVEQQMGSKFISSGALDLHEMFEGSSAKTPLIFILSPGSDPGSQLLRFAKELRGSTLHLDMISLGRGQGPKAEELISKAQILKGRWLFLQNCHLAASWMPKLQTIVDGFQKPNTDIDPQFRLWLSSKPDPSFPISILQIGLKMTVEPPHGVKSNLQRTFGSGGSGVITERMFEDAAQSPAFKNLIFGLCIFNAVLHERKKYGRLGWNIPYEFNESDLEVSVMQLQMLLSEHEEIPWPALRYLTGEVTYGGRVTDDWDRRCLHSLLHKFYTPHALEPDYYYSSDKVYAPLKPCDTFTSAKVYIEKLPNQDGPALFGMNENSEKAYLEWQSSILIDTMLSVQPKFGANIIGSGKSSDEVVQEITADILERLQESVNGEEEEVRPGQLPKLHLHDIIKISQGEECKKFKVDKDNPVRAQIMTLSQSALFTFLKQESDRFDHLLDLIHRSLRSLQLGIKGEIVMSENLEEAYSALLTQKVPEQWQAAAYESCKPLAPWIDDLIQRVEFLFIWSDLIVRAVNDLIKTNHQPSQGGPGKAMMQQEEPLELLQVQPRSFWLSAFYFPQGFLTAVLQNHARKLGVSVDSLGLDYRVTPNTDDSEEWLLDVKKMPKVREYGFKGVKPPEDGVLVFGLFLDGARWNLETTSLSDSLPSQRFYRLPEVHFIPIQVVNRADSTTESPLAMFKASEEENEKRIYECPLYRTSTRAGTLSSTGHSTNFVTAVSLPSDQPPEFWVMRGVALLCQLND